MFIKIIGGIISLILGVVAIHHYTKLGGTPIENAPIIRRMIFLSVGLISIMIGVYLAFEVIKKALVG